MRYDEIQIVNGKETSYLEFKRSFEVIEKHVDESHDTRTLLRDKEGIFWLYDYHEEMNFSGGEDASYEHWFKLDGISDWQKYKDVGIFTLKANIEEYYRSSSPGFKINQKKSIKGGM